MTMHPSKEILRKLIKDELGLDVESVDSSPVVYGEVSLVRFGLLGSLIVYKDDAGVLRAAPVPFGTGMLKKAA